MCVKSEEEGPGEKKRLQYFEFGLQYLVQPLGVNPTYSTFKLKQKEHDTSHFSSCSFYVCWIKVQEAKEEGIRAWGKRFYVLAPSRWFHVAFLLVGQ